MKYYSRTVTFILKYHSSYLKKQEGYITTLQNDGNGWNEIFSYSVLLQYIIVITNTENTTFYLLLIFDKNRRRYNKLMKNVFQLNNVMFKQQEEDKRKIRYCGTCTAWRSFAKWTILCELHTKRILRLHWNVRSFSRKVSIITS